MKITLYSPKILLVRNWLIVAKMQKHPKHQSIDKRMGISAEILSSQLHALPSPGNSLPSQPALRKNRVKIVPSPGL